MEEWQVLFSLNVWVVLSILVFVLTYIIVSLYFIFTLTRGFYKREFTLGLPYGIVIKGDLNEDSVLNNLNNKLIKAEKEKTKFQFMVGIIALALYLQKYRPNSKKDLTDAA